MPTASDAGQPMMLILCCCSTAGKSSSLMLEKHAHDFCPLQAEVCSHRAAVIAITATCKREVHPATLAPSQARSLPW